MKAIETNATLTENGHLTLDEPLTLDHNRRVRNKTSPMNVRMEQLAHPEA
ncbi:MAG: hypothetical protein HC860_26480 [Alkalinema sp. RU_4_3]|nr:hypothetical protein [Alkalinema sp. RU_4_3]